MNKNKLVLIFLFAASVLLSGCYDDREIDETGYIIAVGIDTSDDGDYKYTFQFSAPLAASSGGEEDDDEPSGKMFDAENPTVNNVVVKAQNFYVAKNMLNNFLSKNIDMSHLKLIVFSYDMEKDGFMRHSQLLQYEREVRPHTKLAVAEDSAEAFIRSVNPELEANTSKYYELMALRSNNIYAPEKELRDFTDESSTMCKSSVLPLACVLEYTSSADFKMSEEERKPWVDAEGARVSTSRSDLRGMAVFKDRELLGKMDADSALIYNIMMRDVKYCTVSIRNPNNENEIMTLGISIPKKAAYKIDRNGGKTHITARMTLNAEFIGEQLPTGFDTYDEMYGYAEKIISGKISDFLYSLSDDFGADILNIGKCIRGRYLTIRDWEKANWEEEFKNAEFGAEVKLRHTGAESDAV